MKMTIYDKIEHHKAEVSRLIIKHLKATGWERSCKFPGSTWLWTKEINGKVVAVDRAYAYSMQVQIDSQKWCREGVECDDCEGLPECDRDGFRQEHMDWLKANAIY